MVSANSGNRNRLLFHPIGGLIFLNCVYMLLQIMAYSLQGLDCDGVLSDSILL